MIVLLRCFLLNQRFIFDCMATFDFYVSYDLQKMSTYTHHMYAFIIKTIKFDYFSLLCINLLHKTFGRIHG